MKSESKATENIWAEDLPVWEKMAFLQLSLVGRSMDCSSFENSTGLSQAPGQECSMLPLEYMTFLWIIVLHN